MAAQTYWWAIFEIDSDEALVLETDVPQRAPYWNVQTNDQSFNTLKHVWRQRSLNGRQARIDSEGKFRAVLSVDEPGVPDWLDPLSRTQGSIVRRWYRCDTLTNGKLAKVRNHLPADTPVVTRRNVLDRTGHGPVARNCVDAGNEAQP